MGLEGGGRLDLLRLIVVVYGHCNLVFSRHPQLVDAAIKQVLMNRRETLPASGLTAQDVFYRQVRIVILN